MGTADGRVVGTTRIVDSGDPAERWNLVILAEGYREEELPDFGTHARSFVDMLAATPPFDELRRGINVYRVDVASTDSGAPSPASGAPNASGPAATLACCAALPGCSGSSGAPSVCVSNAQASSRSSRPTGSVA